MVTGYHEFSQPHMTSSLMTSHNQPLAGHVRGLAVSVKLSGWFLTRTLEGLDKGQGNAYSRG